MADNWILLRGLIRESRHWENFDQTFRAQFPADNVYTMDLPGNGTRWRERSPSCIEDMVASLREALSDRGLQPPFNIVALSLGAMTAISWLNDYPGEVARAALLNTSVARFSPFWQRLQAGNYWSILRHGLFARSALDKEQMILSITSNLRSEAERTEIAVRWAGYASEYPVSRANALRQILAAARFRAPESLPSGVPVLVLNGGGDRLVAPQCSADLASGWGLPLAVHPQAGHDLTLDDGVWAADQIYRWARP